MSNFINGVEDMYPEALLKKRMNCEASVIGCFINDIELFDDSGLKAEDFITKDGRILYNVISDLRNHKCTKFDEVSVMEFTTPERREYIDSFVGGYRSLADMGKCVDETNFDSYVDDLNKQNIVLGLYNYGFNVTSQVDINGKKVTPIKLFDKMTADQVVEWYDGKLMGLATGCKGNVIEKGEIDFDDEYFESIKRGEAAGVPFERFADKIDGSASYCLPYFSQKINGLPKGLTFVGGYSNVGKTTLIIQLILAMVDAGRKAVIITNEQRKKDFQNGFLPLILATHFNYYGVTKTKLKKNALTDEDWEMIHKAREYWRENYTGKILFRSIPDSDVSYAVKEMKRLIVNEGVSTCVYDTFKLDFSNDKDNSWLSLIDDSRKFEALTRQYEDVQVICSLQLAINTLGKLFLDSSVLSMSKQIKEVADTMILCRAMYAEEFDITEKQYYCAPFKSIKGPGDTWTEQEWLPTEHCVYRAVFIEKSRGSGEVSSDTGIGYIFKFDGEHGLWKDSAKARFKHTTIGRTNK